MRNYWRVVCFMMLLTDFGSARADMGMITPGVDVTIKEPGQNAIIGFDGYEEILILGTDLEASENTKAVRFIPLPSKPEVSLGSSEAFKNLEVIFKKHSLRYTMKSKMIGASPSYDVEVVFHAQLGAHDVTVVRVNNARDFGDWINDLFRRRGLKERQLSEREREIVEDYIHRSFNYFVFDLVDVGPEVRSIRPLIYRFPTRKFYYPLKASNVFEGRGTIQLFVFGETYLVHESIKRNYYIGGRRQEWFLLWPYVSEYAVVSGEEMRTIAPELETLLGAHALLRAYKYEGEMEFKGDLWLKPDSIPPAQTIRPLSE